MKWATKTILWAYRLIGIDLKPIIVDEHKFNSFAVIYLVFFILGLVAAISALVVAIYATIVGV